MPSEEYNFILRNYKQTFQKDINKFKQQQNDIFVLNKRIYLLKFILFTFGISLLFHSYYYPELLIFALFYIVCSFLPQYKEGSVKLQKQIDELTELKKNVHQAYVLGFANSEYIKQVMQQYKIIITF